MAVSELLRMAWTVLEWTVDWIFIICLVIFCMIIGWTVITISNRIAEMSMPGVNKVLGRVKSRRRG